MAGDAIRPLQLVSGADDVELEAIRSCISNFEVVSNSEDVVRVVRGHSERGEQVEVLDLIGHSRSPGFLVLGTWVIDDSPQTAASFSELLRPWLVRLGVRTIRVLGCSTCATDRARNALFRIERATRCEVLGTCRYLSLRDYGPAGFLSGETLASANGKRGALGSSLTREAASCFEGVIPQHSENRVQSL